MKRHKKILALCLVLFLLPQAAQSANNPGDFTPDQARELFKQSISSLQNKEYESAIGGFQKIYESFPKKDPGSVSAYKIACAYALLGKADDSVGWIEKSIGAGFCDVVQLRMAAELN